VRVCNECEMKDGNCHDTKAETADRNGEQIQKLNKDQ
jgi:hypothetical protein